MGRRPPRSTGSETLCPCPTLLRSQGLGIVAGVLLSPAGPTLLDLSNIEVSFMVNWYGLEARPNNFFLAAAAGFLAWALFAVYRALCSALQKPVWPWRSEEHTSELHSLMRTSYAGFCLKTKKH